MILRKEAREIYPPRDWTALNANKMLDLLATGVTLSDLRVLLVLVLKADMDGRTRITQRGVTDLLGERRSYVAVSRSFRRLVDEAVICKISPGLWVVDRAYFIPTVVEPERPRSWRSS